MGTFGDTLASLEQHQKNICMTETWGHLAPSLKKRYKGTMLFAHGAYGDLVPLSADFKRLPNSPWFFQNMMNFISENTPVIGVYRFVGTYQCLNDERTEAEFVGKVTMIASESILPAVPVV